MRIAVIDDERPARSELRHQLLELLPDAVIEEGDCGAKALEIAGEEKYDICFLDINLGDINGTVLVNALRTMQPEMKIVFVTAYSEYAVQAFELGVEDYIMKPCDRKRLEKVLRRCMAQPDAAARTEAPSDRAAVKRLAISSNGKTVFEDIKDIVYIETYNRGCLIHTAGNEYRENKPIGEYEKKLEDMGFFRIHKSYLINLDKVKEVFPWGNNSFSLKMKGYEENILPIGRDKTKILRQKLGY